MNQYYKKTVNLLTSKEKFHISLGLNRVGKILELLDNPQNKLKIIHIAGTNGKGSTCAMLSQILTCTGYKTGLYTSPHIVEYTERIKINNKNISYTDFYKYIFEINQLSKENEIYLTEFEILTCCAYKYFADKNTDICIIETGLGGRLDATNVINKNIASIITSISLDHIDRLGDSIEKIAKEKAGIIKQQCPTIIDATNNGIDIIKKIASEKNSELIQATKNIELEFKNNKNFIKYKNQNYEFSLLGTWQKENVKLVFTTIEYLNNIGFEITPNALKNGLRTVFWPCRMQFIQKYNLLIDGSHNPDGAKVLKESLEYYFPDKKRIWIYGSINTKDYKKVIDTLFNDNDEVYFYHFDYPSAVEYQKLHQYYPKSRQINNRELKYLIEENTDKLIIISGSFYMIGQILEKNDKFLTKYCHGG